jgi:hypothetical protein
MRRHRFPTVASLTLASALALGLAACAVDDVGSAASYSTDSFANPTEHGELQFGTPNTAEFTTDNRFHSWTFTLSDDADIEIKTEIGETNLDTVLYLYRRGEDGNWGQNIDKNDDYDDLLASRLSGAYGPGEYRIKVKTTKESMRGAFAVLGQCSGAGCPVVGGECHGEGPANLPVITGYTTACDATFYAILTTPASAAPPECAGLIEQRAVQYYKDYWDGIYGYEELAGGPDVEPDVSIQYHPGAGAVVDVGLGGDEDAMDFVFDAEGKLRYYYQHNQSPDWAWFCADEHEEPMAEPDEDCFQDAVSHSDYNVEDVSSASGVTAAGERTGLPPAVAAAVAEYAAAEGVGAADEVSYEYRLWAAGYTGGAEVTLAAAGRSTVTYVVAGDPEWGLRIVFREDEAGVSFLCKEL